MTEGVAGPRRSPWLNPVDLMQDGVSRIRAAGAPFWIIWGVYGALVLAAQLGAQTAGVSGATPSPPAIAYQVFLAILTSVVEVLGLHRLLQGEEGWLRLDGRKLYAAGLLAGAQLAIAAGTMLMPSAKGGGTGGVLFGLSLYLAGVYMIGKLALWPVGIIAGEPQLTPLRAWRAMRRTLRSLVLTMMILSVPTIVVALFGVIALRTTADTQPASMIAAATLGAVLMSLVSQGVVVSIYERRVRAPRTLAAVFE